MYDTETYFYNLYTNLHSFWTIFSRLCEVGCKFNPVLPEGIGPPTAPRVGTELNGWTSISISEGTGFSIIDYHRNVSCAPSHGRDSTPNFYTRGW